MSAMDATFFALALALALARAAKAQGIILGDAITTITNGRLSAHDLARRHQAERRQATIATFTIEAPPPSQRTFAAQYEPCCMRLFSLDGRILVG
ncbi:hypothetical protein B0T14DRAFT_517713 [Immersiella caudata]|uniref:Uncharacterized protein n=1 Tax=Immersiella caudata TaxID=314043 RepID=A0AA40C4N9_9PEZI|nr:hypothetical protein B0T14DRAFT_517713 [Immersiella caudata]